ncbi:MAG TPA: hypothetical protein VGG27_03660 [Magnetospirillaceae bacterium]|jgi:hypothetical protein
MRWIAALSTMAVVAIAMPALADETGDKIETARTAYSHGDGLHTLEALQAAQSAITTKLVEQFSHVLPPAPAGWQAADTDSQTLDTIGGGLTITRGYVKGESTLNASLLVDNPAVANILSLFQPGANLASGDGGWRSVTVAGEPALLRFNAANREGEIVLAVQGRAALQVEGGEIATDQVLIDAAGGWNLAQLKKLLGP